MNCVTSRPEMDTREVGAVMPEDEVRPSVPELTGLQLKCLEGFWNRRSAKQIAADLGISEAWVNKNLLTARRRLHVTSSADAAAIVFGGKRGSIKSYYYQETDLPAVHERPDQAHAVADKGSFALAASERPLINSYGPLATLAGVVLIAMASIVGVTLMIDAGEGFYQLLKALGY
jgi:DNA-binding CsgD family transcriptional regulator